MKQKPLTRRDFEKLNMKMRDTAYWQLKRYRLAWDRLFVEVARLISPYFEKLGVKVKDVYKPKKKK